VREQIIFWSDDYFPFVLDQHVELDFYSANSLKQQSVGIHVTPLWHIILIGYFCIQYTSYNQKTQIVQEY
jgi:hypothetical protein